MSFKWTPKMQIDNGLIDEDHKQLISIANRLLELDHPNRDAEELKQIIRELYNYVTFHFAREEGLMYKFKYPEIEAHREKHKAIINDMNFHLTSSHHMADVLIHFKDLVNKWVINHIMEEDKKIHKYLQSNSPEN